MALTLITSNRVESLQARLAQQLAANPLRDPFSAELIVVPTYAMGRWLNLRIAQQQGIAANIEYPQLGEWLWSLAGSVLGDTTGYDPYSGAPLCWRIFGLLPQLLEHESFVPLRDYLADDSNGIKRWQLAQRIAQCFDRYQTYRPQMIRRWSAGDDDQWQARLWRQLVKSTGQAHRADILLRLVEHLLDSASELELPPRISLFAISSLPPYLVELVHALARNTTVQLYQHSPSEHYWADLVNAKQHARLRLQDPVQAEYHASDNHLLASWGRQGQAMQDLLLDLGSITAVEIEDLHPPGDDSLLQCLQGSLFELTPRERPVEDDDSLRINLCHSPMRECQVLHDYLLMLLDCHPELSSEDILVMVPEISRYAPYIEAVFQYDGGNRRPSLNWNISDISVRDGQPLAQAFLWLLKLPVCRFTSSDILTLLEFEEIRNRFGIRQQAVDDIQHLIATARVRWGLSAQHRQELGLPSTNENTWQQAWDRLLAGYAMPEGDLWHGIAVIADVDSETASAFARVRYLFERLALWQKRLSQTTSADNWQRQLHHLIEEFLTSGPTGEDQLPALRNAISELGQSESTELTPALVSYWIENQLANTQQPGRLYSGGVTFCGMQPMRNIPFPVICILGMQDGAFPRRDNPPEFDLMQKDWHPGDPRKGDEDRYLMLETLLCARRYLYFSYCGRSLKDNSECQPSVLLRELLDYIDSSFDPGGDPRAISERLIRVQPMQAFSWRNFQPDIPAYDGYWFDAARQLAQKAPPEAEIPWKRQPLASSPISDDSTDLEILLRFYRHPIRFFFNTRLGVLLPPDNVAEDEESFGLQGLPKWELATRLAARVLTDRRSDAEQFSAEGLLPHGQAAHSEWQALQQEYRQLLERLQEYRGQQAVARPVDCRRGSALNLSGVVGACYAGTGLLHFSASKSVKSRALLSLWLNHLALCAAGQLAPGESSQLITPSSTAIRFTPIDSALAQTLLSGYIELFRQGTQYPLPVFPDTSYAWAGESDHDKAMQKARDAWLGGSYRDAPRAECEDDFIRLALHNNTRNPLEDPLFQDCARRIYRPAIEQKAQP